MTDVQILGLAIGGQAAVVLIAIVGGVLYSNSRITDLRDTMNKRFDDMNTSVNRRFDDANNSVNKRFDDANNTVSKRFDDLRDLLKSEVKRLEERITHTLR